MQKSAYHFQRTYHCNVTENDKRGIMVIRMEAEDHDDPGRGANAQITYSITKNAIEESTSKPVFEIDSETGKIRTSICCLDRERTPLYFLEVVAIDGGGLNGRNQVVIYLYMLYMFSDISSNHFCPRYGFNLIKVIMIFFISSLRKRRLKCLDVQDSFDFITISVKEFIT